MKSVKLEIFVGVLLLISSASWAIKDLSTIAEKSGWQRTGRSIETENLCKDFAKQFPKRVRCESYGQTPEGRTLWYMQVSDAKPSKAKAPAIWVQAGIHAGEIDGKDALFLLMKEVFTGQLKTDPFKGLTVVFVPIVNLDGHERMGKWNRPNQVGPEEMGWRTTAENYNLNRDFAKVEASEMRDLNILWNKVDPIVSLDLHVTDGAKFRPEVGIIVTPNESHGDSLLHKAGQQLEDIMMKKLKSMGRSALPFYPSFENDDDPSSGFSKNVSPPRFANGYWFARNRIGVLVESHSWKDYSTRIKVHHDTILSALEAVQKNGSQWSAAARQIESENLAGKKIDVAFKHTAKAKTIEFEGYKYTKEKSKISGVDVIRYFDDKPEMWKVPFYDEILPTVTVHAPEKGYFIPRSEFSWIKKKLDTHGIKYELWSKKRPEKAFVFRASKAQVSATSFEGRQTLTVEGQWQLETVQWPIDVYFVPIEQRSGLMVVHLLEPLAPDSFLNWGFFNRFFEVKEYMEDYVIEDVAIQMLANDPKVKKEFEEKLKDDTFAKDPAKRNRFFHLMHPSWDDRYNRYPLFKI